MWETWITCTHRKSIFPENTAFRQNRAALTHSIHRRPCGKPGERRKLSGLHKSSQKVAPRKNAAGFSAVFSVRFFCGGLRRICDSAFKKERLKGKKERFRAIKNPGRGPPGRSVKTRAESGAGEGGGRSPYGSVKVSRSTSSCVLFFISRSMARRVASSLSPRISV